MDTSELRTRLAELHPLSFGWALNCCEGDPALAEDVLQIACLKVLNGKARYEAGNSAFKTWFFGVIRNTAREERRRVFLRRIKLIDFEIPAATTSPDPESDLQRSEKAQRIRDQLNQLSRRQREVLHLVFYQDMTVDEAARTMKVSIGSARTHYARGKSRLRKLLEEDDE